MEIRKIGGIVLFVVGLIFAILNLVVIYPSINCTFAPYVFWLVVVICIIVGSILYFNLKVFHT